MDPDVAKNAHGPLKEFGKCVNITRFFYFLPKVQDKDVFQNSYSAVPKTGLRKITVDTLARAYPG